jgi:hypothetical protein
MSNRIRAYTVYAILAIAIGVGAFAMAGCSASAIQRNLDTVQQGVDEADRSVEELEAMRQAILADLALLPPGDPGRESLIDALEKLDPVIAKWVGVRDDYQARADQLAADLVAAGDDDAAATMYAGAGMLELAAAFGLPFAGLGGLLLRQIANQRRITTDTAYGIASARAASTDFNDFFNDPGVGGILRANMPKEIAKIAKQANAEAGVKGSA